MIACAQTLIRVPSLAPLMRLLLSGLLLVLVGCGEPQPRTIEGSDPQAEAELRQRVEEYYRTLSARDWEEYRTYFWPNASLTTVWQPPGETAERVVMTSIGDFIENAGAGPDSQPIFEERLISQELRIVENLGQVWAHYEARFGDSSDVATWRGVDAFNWMKHNGEWRIVGMAYANEPEQ